MTTLPSQEKQRTNTEGKKTDKDRLSGSVIFREKNKCVTGGGGGGVVRCGCCSLEATLQQLGGTGGACQCFVANRGGVDGAAG